MNGGGREHEWPNLARALCAHFEAIIGACACFDWRATSSVAAAAAMSPEKSRGSSATLGAAIPAPFDIVAASYVLSGRIEP